MGSTQLRTPLTGARSAPPPGPLVPPPQRAKTPGPASPGPNGNRQREWDREYRDSRPQRKAAPLYVEVGEDVNHHRKIEAVLQALGYQYAWLQKRWRVWRDSRYAADFSADIHRED